MDVVPMTLRQAWQVLKSAGIGWSNDRASSMGAAIAYYTIFSLAPTLLVAIAVAGFAFGRDAAEGAIVGELGTMIGRDGADAVQTMIRSADDMDAGIIATVIGVATLLLTSTGVFVELQSALNVIWKAPPAKRSGWWSLLRTRLLSLSMVFGIGFILLVSLVLSAGLTAVSDRLAASLPGLPLLLQAVTFLVSLAITALLFAMIYKVLPDVPIAWRDVATGAVLTAILFSIGRFAIGYYIGSSDLASSFGAATALVVILVWVYYSSQILLFGAEFTRAYAELRGTRSGEAAETGKQTAS